MDGWCQTSDALLPPSMWGSLLEARPLTNRPVPDSQRVKSAAKSVQKKAGMAASKAEPKQAKQAKSGGLFSNVAKTVCTCCRQLNMLALSKCCDVATSSVMVPQSLRVLAVRRCPGGGACNSYGTGIVLSAAC